MKVSCLRLNDKFKLFVDGELTKAKVIGLDPDYAEVKVKGLDNPIRLDLNAEIDEKYYKPSLKSGFNYSFFIALDVVDSELWTRRSEAFRIYFADEIPFCIDFNSVAKALNQTPTELKEKSGVEVFTLNSSVMHDKKTFKKDVIGLEGFADLVQFVNSYWYFDDWEGKMMKRALKLIKRQYKRLKKEYIPFDF